MDIAAMAIMMSQTHMKQQAHVVLMDKTLNHAKVQSDGMVKMMEESIQPHLGSHIDFKA